MQTIKRLEYLLGYGDCKNGDYEAHQKPIFNKIIVLKSKNKYLQIF